VKRASHVSNSPETGSFPMPDAVASRAPLHITVVWQGAILVAPEFVSVIGEAIGWGIDRACGVNFLVNVIQDIVDAESSVDERGEGEGEDEEGRWVSILSLGAGEVGEIEEGLGVERMIEEMRGPL
jgi:hypothetical protein